MWYIKWLKEMNDDTGVNLYVCRVVYMRYEAIGLPGDMRRVMVRLRLASSSISSRAKCIGVELVSAIENSIGV